MINRIFIYNILNGSQILLGLLFQLIIAKTFGASAKTDIYFTSTILVAFISAISLLFSEMFMQHYNDLYVSDSKDAERFYNAVYTLSIFIGFISYIIGIFLLPLLVMLFAPGFDEYRITMLKSFFYIQGFSLIWVRAFTLNNSLINAHMRFMLPYVLGVIIQTFNIIILMLLSKSLGIFVIAFAMVISGLITLMIQHIYINRKLNIQLSPILWHSKIRALIKTSVPLRLGHQVWGLRDMLTFNILSHFPAGTISIFSYAWKIITMVFTVTNSPVLQIFQSKISRMISNNNYFKINKLQKEAIYYNVALFSGLVVLTAIVLPLIFNIFLSYSIQKDAFRLLFFIFLALIPVHLLMSIEMPFVQIVIALKRGDWILKINLIFIAIYVLLALSLKAKFSLFCIPVALLIAEGINMTFYVWFILQQMKESKWNVQAIIP